MKSTELKIIGYTNSGKAVFDINVIHPVFGLEGSHHDFVQRYKHFTKQDHKDAIELHLKECDKCNENWQTAYDSVTTNQWNIMDQKACKATKEAGKQFDKHAKLIEWHKNIS